MKEHVAGVVCCARNGAMVVVLWRPSVEDANEARENLQKSATALGLPWLYYSFPCNESIEVELATQKASAGDLG